MLQLERENEMIFYDGLTGMHNRRFFNETIDRVLKSLSRTGDNLSIMMIDIDFFKNYNDTYGHCAGDECLKKVCDVISKSVSRVDDFAARYGGEEFVVVMPNTAKDGALLIAKKILDQIWGIGIPHESSEAANCVTVSIGVTTGNVQRDHIAEMFVNKADEMLYLSKQSGRNKYSYQPL
jgi:diguanylate cyclase (GGDEF)-like protein